MMDMSELEKIRSEIDKVDRELSRLIELRMALVGRVAEYKKQTKTEIVDMGREKRVLENALSCIENLEYRDSIKAIFENMMSVSKQFQKDRLTKTGLPRRYALIGERLSHSLSPVIHKVFFEKTQIEGTYELIEVPADQVSALVEKLSHEGYSGLNVTIPYKTEIMRSLDSLSEEALRVGAVNTVKIGKTSKGFNTDYYGFGKALEFNGINPAGKACAILGSGGSSRAVVSYLEDHGASRIAIITRDTDATSLKYPGLQSIDITTFKASGYDLIVNTTPVGMFPKSGFSPLRQEQIRGASFILDLIYNPKATELMCLAAKEGIPSANGLYMLVAQAVCAQEIWQEKPFDRALIESMYKEINAL